MTDPWQPTPDEIRAWAYDAHAAEPCQDWDLALAWSGHERALLECASDDTCPRQAYMLAVLYLIVGDAVRTGFQSRPRAVIEGFLDFASAFCHPSIQLWQQRSRALLRDPSTFTYEAWCAGGLAREAGR